MPFEMRLNEDRTMTLAAVCDVCGKVIADAAGANILWPEGDNGLDGKEPGATCRASITCKESGCSCAADRIAGHRHRWIGLNMALHGMLRRIRYSQKVAQGEIKVRKQCGAL